MNRFRFSIRSFLIVVTLLAGGLAAIVSQSRLATSLAYTAFLVLLCVSLAGAILAGNNRAFWLGLATFGWMYWFVEFDASGGKPRPAASIAFLSSLVASQPSPPPAPAGLLTSELMELLEARMTPSREVGSKVIAQWRGGTYYSGTISDAKDGQYLIVWDDGSAPQWTPPSQIQPNSPNLRIAAHATLGGLFALVGGVLVGLLFGGRPAEPKPPPDAARGHEGQSSG
jgi:hypothetical protein